MAQSSSRGSVVAGGDAEIAQTSSSGLPNRPTLATALCQFDYGVSTTASLRADQPCRSFDLVVAAYVAVAYRFGLVGSRQTELRGAPVPAR